MTLRELEREIISAAVEWHVAGSQLLASDKTEERFEKSLGLLTEAITSYLKEALVAALDATEPTPEKRQYGDGRVFKRRDQFWIAYYVDGKEIRQPAGNSEEAARTALIERKAIEAHDAALPKPASIPEQTNYKKTTKTPIKTPIKTGVLLPPPPVAEHPVHDAGRQRALSNKECENCERTFRGHSSAKWCPDCKTKKDAPLLPPAKGKEMFADRRCLGCEEPFKSFQGQRHCDRCIKTRLESAKTNVGELDDVPLGKRLEKTP